MDRAALTRIATHAPDLPLAPLVRVDASVHLASCELVNLLDAPVPTDAPTPVRCADLDPDAVADCCVTAELFATRAPGRSGSVSDSVRNLLFRHPLALPDPVTSLEYARVLVSSSNLAPFIHPEIPTEDLHPALRSWSKEISTDPDAWKSAVVDSVQVWGPELQNLHADSSSIRREPTPFSLEPTHLGLLDPSPRLTGVRRGLTNASAMVDLTLVTLAFPSPRGFFLGPEWAWRTVCAAGAGTLDWTTLEPDDVTLADTVATLARDGGAFPDLDAARAAARAL